jgi:type I restriction enzyme S subunit
MKAGWQKKKLSQVCELINGRAYRKPELLSEGKYRVLRVGNFFTNENWYYSDLELEDNKYCDHGDLLYAWSASFGPRIWAGEKVIFHYHIWKVKHDLEQIEQQFLFYFFEWDKELLKLEKGAGTTMIHVSKGSMEERDILVPPLPEQQRIVAILDEAFEAIAAARANSEQNRQNARALFESVLSSVDGETAALGDYVTIKTGKLDANAAVEGGIYPFFTCAREIYAIDNFAFDCEAILLAGNNAVGDFNVKHYSGKFNAYQRTYVITINNEDQLLYRFLYFQMLKSLKRFKEQSVGAGTKFLKLGMIKDLEIILPSVDLQRRIVSTLDSVLEETTNLEALYQRKLEALDELKQSLLQQAFSGQL